MKQNILDASKCETSNEIIELMEKDMKRRKSIGFKIKKFIKKMF